MSSDSYSFLDVAVLDEIRQRFAAGDAIAVLSVDLEQVIWANGPGAAVFGYPDIEAIIGASTRLPPIVRRQIMATAGFPEIGSGRAVMIRLATGMTSQAVAFLASTITMPDGERAILLAAAATRSGSQREAEIAARAIGGFTEDGHFIAFIDGGGRVEAASEGFSALDISAETLTALVAEVADENDRIIKRLIPGGAASYPAGLARLTENPARHLLVVIDEDQFEDEASADERDGKAPDSADTSVATVSDKNVTAAADDRPAESTTAGTSTLAAQVSETGTDIAEQGKPAEAERVAEESAREPSEPPQEATGPGGGSSSGSSPKESSSGDDQNGAETPARHDYWYFNAGDDGAPSAQRTGSSNQTETPQSPAAPAQGSESGEALEAGRQAATVDPIAPAIDRAAAPVRFVWRTDAEGKFSAISPEFAETVGKAAADIIGRSFKEVTAAFGLDPSGEIAGLLERRDTWSGRSVSWPVAGTDLKLPVDLAALPVYGRGRAFEGFRGFGVARIADAIVDPEATGLALVPQEAPAEATIEPPATETAADPFQGEVPALAIVPQQERRFTDKVIRLAEHRQPANDKGLSTLERSAFREIGERLKKESAPESGGAKTGDASGPETADAAQGGEAVGAPASQSDAGSQTPSAGPSLDLVADRKADDAGLLPPSGEIAESADAFAGKPDEDESDIAPKEHDTAPLRTPATLPGQLNDGGPPPGLQASDEDPSSAATENAGIPDDSATLAAISDAEDERDLARLDGEMTASAESGTDRIIEPAGTDTRPASPATYPDEASEDDGDNDNIATAGDAPDAENDPAPAVHDGRQPTVTSSDEPLDETTSPRSLLDYAHRSSEAEAPAAATGGTAEPVTPEERPRVDVPPLATKGFIPSAFSTGSAARDVPDTSILDSLPVPLLIHSGDVLHYANAEFLDLTGYDKLADLENSGGLGALFADPYGDDGASGEADRTLRLRTLGGSEFPVEAILRSVPWRGGKALMLIVRRSGEARLHPDAEANPSQEMSGEQVQPDVSELKARIAEMRTIIDTATDGVVLIGRDGTIRSISRPAEALFSFDSDEVTGKPFASLFAIESQRAARDYLNGLSDHGVASVLNDGREVIGREAEGRFIPLFMTIGRLPNESGYCAVVRDITQWKRAEEDLTQARAVAERASSHKTDFLARISHEIRTPLNAIIGFSELMVDEKFGPVANDRYRDYLRDINRSGNHVLDLVNDLLDISKIEAGQQEMDYEAVSLNDTLAETVAMMQPQANRERVIIRSSFASRLPEVVADLRSVRQIALNVLSNAIRYTQAGGQVIVSTAYEPSGDVVMRVRDTGVGMSQAEIEQALKPFKQINALKRGRGDGTGLGLPLTKAMVEANRARFAINSTPGEGTLVEVAFPSTRVLAD